MSTAQAKQDNQSQHWDQWSQYSAHLQKQWADFFKEWQGRVKGDDLPGANAYQKMFTQSGQQFLDMIQQFQRATGQSKSAEDTAKDWAAGLQSAFSGLFQNIDIAETYKSFMTLGENMMKAGNAWAHNFSQPGTQGWGSTQNLDPMGFMASIPGIGYTREKQDELHELYKLWVAYDRSSQKYNAAMAHVGLEAAQKFQSFLVSPPADAPKLKSIKDVYVKWVDICEDVYARYAVSKEYTDLYGDTVNALMAYKKQVNKLTDDFVAELNLPTRKEMDSLHERAHMLRRDNIELKKEVAALKKAVFKTREPAVKVKHAAKGKKK